jgi:hypothetical protein
MIDENAANPNAYSPFLSTDIDYGYFTRRDGHPFAHPAYALLLAEAQRVPGLDAAAGQDRTLADILTYVFHSKLHFYLRYGTPCDLATLHAEVEREVRFVLCK